jgi:hypothetical protein
MGEWRHLSDFCRYRQHFWNCGLARFSIQPRSNCEPTHHAADSEFHDRWDTRFTQATFSPIGVGNSPLGIQVADFNGDHKLDMAVVNGGDNTVGILLSGLSATATLLKPSIQLQV